MKFANHLLLVGTFFIFLLSPCTAKSDTICLINGDIISGELITLSEGLCVFSSKYGPFISLRSEEITGLFTEDDYEIKFISGEIVRGNLSRTEDDTTVLVSKNFGESKINPANIISMTRVFPSSKKDSLSHGQEQSFGKEENKSPPLDFLTGSTVLLAPGSYELGLGFSYLQSRRNNSLMNVGYFQRSAYSARKFGFTLTGRAGLYDKLEGWLTLPLTYTYIQEVSTNEYVRDTESWDLGDISLGLQYLLVPETEKSPAISVSLSVNAPTGKKKYYDSMSTWLDPLNNSSGHWDLTIGTSFVRTLDPAILFGGLSYSHSFPETIDGYNIAPGWGANGYFGFGFALNEKISIGSRLALGYQSTMEVDGITVEGSDSEPMDLSFSASYRFGDNWVVTPQVTFTLNDDAGANSFSLQVARRY